MSTKDHPKLSVLVLSHTSDLTGGAELSMLDVFDKLADNFNVSPAFIIRQPIKALSRALEDRNWAYHALPYTFWSETHLPKDSYGTLRAAAVNNKAVIEIGRIIKDTNPDLVVTNSIISPWAAIAAYINGYPHVWFAREYGDLDHGREFLLGASQTFGDIGHLSDLVVANSATLQHYLESFIAKQKLTTLYTPFDIEGLVKKSEQVIANPYRHNDSLRLCIAAGSIVESKGQLEIVNAVGELNKVGHLAEVCLVGRADNKAYHDKIIQSVKKYDIADKVHFVGHHPNPLPYMAAADVGIMTSRMEAFGRVTFEYLALGKPVVGANSGATPEMVKPGINGFLFDRSDAADLTNQLMNYAENRSLIKTHGQASKKIAKEMMEGKQNLDALYTKLVKVIRDSQKNPRELPPQNLIEHWLGYPELALQANGLFGQLTKQQLKSRAKDAIRPIYHRLRNMKTRVLGK